MSPLIDVARKAGRASVPKEEHDSHGYALTHVLQVEDDGTRPAPGYGRTPRQRAPQEECFIKKKQKRGRRPGSIDVMPAETGNTAGIPDSRLPAPAMPPTVGLGPTTTRLRALCSAD